MKTNHGTWQRPSGLRAAVMLGLFAGTATGAGFLLAGIPNLELMSLIVALSGAVLGARMGGICGALAAGIYSLGSPYGIPVVWILGAQMAGLAAIGALGGIWGLLVLERMGTKGRLRFMLMAAGLGFLGTTCFEVATTLAVLWGFGLDSRVVLVGAVPFYLMHTGSNIMLFAIFFPPLAQRLRHTGSGALRGSVNAGVVPLLWLILFSSGSARAQDTLETAAVDSVLAPQTDMVVSAPDTSVHGWTRGLWHPFSQSLVDFLAWHGDFIPVQDGGLGAPVRILGEVSTTPYPLVMRAGLPLGTGHILADDPGLVPIAGMQIQGAGFGMDPWGGSGGQIQLSRLDPAPTEAFSSYQGTSGAHETYMRHVQLLTPQAPWRFGFEFQENLDNEGYNFTDLPGEEFDPVLDTYFPGHARLRQSHARLTRNLGPWNRLDVDYDYARQTKDQLPALAAGHEEIWADGISADMHAGSERFRVRTAIFWRNRDVRLGASSASTDTSSRLLETGREGILLELSLHQGVGETAIAEKAGMDSVSTAQPDSTTEAPVADPDSVTVMEPEDLMPVQEIEAPPEPRRFFQVQSVKLRLSLENWTLDDSGPDTSWAGPLVGAAHLDGQQAMAAWESRLKLMGLDGRIMFGGLWTDRLGWDPTAAVNLWGRYGPIRWGLFGETAGRAPRSDELGTTLRYSVAGSMHILDPNPGLGREQTRRWGGNFAADIAGLSFAIDGAVGRLEDGITWLAATDDLGRGQLVNGANLDFRRMTASVEHQGRFMGWGRIRYEGTWQDFTSDGLPLSSLPPEQYSRLKVMWENHLFVEDGVLEIALFSTHVGAMTDPWDVTRSFVLPARTTQDLVVGFRLVGVDLSLAWRNLTGKRYHATSGAWAPGSETVMRMAWKFRR